MTPMDYVTAAACISGFTADDILGRSSQRPLAAWRQATMTAIRDECGWSYPLIGRMFSRDHTTAIHAVQVCAADAGRRRMVERIKGAAGVPHPHLRIIDGGGAA